MMHISCDICGKKITDGEDHRYVVKIEVFAAHDPAELTEDDLDQDHVEAVSQLLNEMADDVPDPDEVAPAYKNFRYDLCPDCQKKFVRDPLSKDGVQKFHFSKNRTAEPNARHDAART